MGGSGGGSFSSVDFAELEKRILERLQGLARSANKIVFACEEQDARSLASHMVRAGIAEGEKVALTIGPGVSAQLASIEHAQLLVTFSDSATGTTFLDKLIEAAFVGRKQGIHVKAHEGATIPSRILAYRWRTMSWDELTSLLK